MVRTPGDEMFDYFTLDMVRRDSIILEIRACELVYIILSTYHGQTDINAYNISLGETICMC